jgi:coatomer subunit beta
MVLKKEIVKTQNKDFEKGGEYRQMLVQAIHGCAVKFPDVAASVVHLLMDFLGDSNTSSSLDVVFFVREITETNQRLRQGILERLRDTFYQIRASRVCSCALWILGEYSASPDEVQATVEVIKQALGPLPLLSARDGEDGAGEAHASAPQVAPASTGSRRPAVLADGTYATQTAVVEAPVASAATPLLPNLRALLLGGDFFLGGVIASTLTKLMLRMKLSGSVSPAAANKASAEAMLVIVAMLRLGESTELPSPLDDDSKSRMMQCLQLMANPQEELVQVRGQSLSWASRGQGGMGGWRGGAGFHATRTLDHSASSPASCF